MTSHLSHRITKKLILGVLFALPLFFYGATAHADVLLPGNISTCGELAAPGTYTLTANITASSSQTCFTVSSDDVTIDGADHTVTGNGNIAVDARTYDSGSLVKGAHAHTDLLIKDIIFSGFTSGLNASGNDDPDGTGVNGGYGGDGGDVAIYYSTIGSIYADGGNSSTFSYGGLGGNIVLSHTDLNISNTTISAKGGTGTSGRNTDGGLNLGYTGAFTHTNVILSPLSYFNVNGSSIEAPYPGGTWPIAPGTITSCGTLLGSGTYTLSQDISNISGTCFTLASNDIVINGAGHSITSTSSNTNFAVEAGTYSNFTLASTTVGGFSNLINATSSVTIANTNIDLRNQRINAGSLTLTYTGNLYYNGFSFSNLSSLIINGTNYGAWGAGVAPTGAGGSWKEQTGSGYRSWLSIASSADGKKLVAGEQYGYLYTSTDAGVTWTQRTGPGYNYYWHALTSSADGMKLAAASWYGTNWSTGYIYTSTDGGATWTQQTSAGQRNWRSITSSADGMKLAAVNGNNGYIYTSTDGGATWTQQTSAGQRSWNSITSSSDGKKLVAANSGYIYTSTDGGATWTERTGAGSRNWISVASTPDGNKLVAAVSNGYIYTSTDSGVTWTERTGAGSHGWQYDSVTLSADGMKLAVAANGDYIYTSTDGGSTWMQQTEVGSRNWYAITSSADGGKFVVALNSGYVYSSQSPFPAVSVYINSPSALSTISTWSPYILWGISTTCEYSFDNFVTPHTVSCANSGSDIPNPGYGTSTLSVRGTSLEGVVSTSSATFSYVLPVTIVSPTSVSTPDVSTWNPSVIWDVNGAGNITTCQYSYSNFTGTSTKTANCLKGGSDILPPSASGVATLSVRATDVNGVVGNASVTFSYAGNGMGSWVQRSSSRNWTSSASSDNGLKLAATVSNGYIYTSTDSGVTWTERTGAGSRDWKFIASSADGAKLAAAAANGYIWTSTDSGATWTQRTNSGSRNWVSLASSGDGTKLIAGVWDGYVYMSNDSGSTWSQISTSYLPYGDWENIAISPDGTKIAIINVYYGGYIYTSSNGGSTWTTRSSIGTKDNWSDITISADGTKLAVNAGWRSGGNYIYTSTDSGATWVQRTSAGQRTWTSLAASSDGTKLVAAATGGYLYISNDSGVTWTEQTTVGTKTWNTGSVASSIDGSKFVAVANSGSYIYTYSVPAAVLTLYRPEAGSTVTLWSPYVNWVTSTTCQYSYNNFASTSTANCSYAGSDIAAPSSYGTSTLYIKGTVGTSTVTKSATFNYVASVAAGSIGSCGYIINPGTYTLNADISNVVGSCFNITTGGAVTIDGNGHTITASGGNTNPALNITNGSTVTLQNLKLSGFSKAFTSNSDVTVSSSTLGTTTLASTGLINLFGNNLDISNQTINANSLNVSYTGTFTFFNTILSALSSLTVNGVSYGSFFGGAFPVSPESGSLSTCGSITAAGTYSLSSDITGVTGTCFNIRADGVTIDGNGHTVIAANGNTSFAVMATSTATGTRGYNVNIQNITFSGFAGGVNATGKADNNNYYGHGGTITIASSTLGSVVSNGAGQYYGNGGTINITNSTITGTTTANSSRYSANGGTINITNSTTTGVIISATGNNQGGTITFSSSSTLDISHVLIAASSTSDSHSSDGSLTVSASGTITTASTTLSALAHLTVNGTDYGAYGGGAWPTFSTTLSSCGDIGFAGTYTVSQDITGVTGTCFNVKANNVIINGNGHTITSATTSNSSFAITGTGYSSGLTINNLYLSNFANGINWSGPLTLTGTDIDLTNQYINTNGNALTLIYTGNIATLNTTLSSISDLKLNDIDFGYFTGGAFPWSSQTISNCGDLTAPGTYVLTRNITGVTGTCFNIKSDLVVIDGNNHTITGAAGNSNYAVDATVPVVLDGGNNYSSGGNAHTGIAIKNITFSGFGGGVNARGLDNDGTIYDRGDGFSGGTLVISSSTLGAIDTSGGNGNTNTGAGSYNGGSAGTITITNSHITSPISANGGIGYFSWSNYSVSAGNGANVTISTSTVSADIYAQGGNVHDDYNGYGSQYSPGSHGTVTTINSIVGTIHADDGGQLVGCMDSGAINYDSIATYDPGSFCQYVGSNADNPSGNTVNGPITFNGYSNNGVVNGDAYYEFNWDFYGGGANNGTTTGNAYFDNNYQWMFGTDNNGVVGGDAYFYSGTNYNIIHGSAYFTYGQNNGTVEGNADFTWNGGDGWNYGTVNGNATFSYADRNQGTVNGSITIMNGCTDPNAANYVPGAQWDDGSCQYYGQSMDNPAGHTINNGLQFWGYQNYGTVNGDSYFDYGNNYGVVTGNVNFGQNGGNANNYGTINGNADFYNGSTNYGTVTGNITYHDYTATGGKITITDSSFHNGTVGGLTLDTNGDTISEIDFYGTGNADGNITGNVVFNDTSYINGNVVINGNVTLNTSYYGISGSTLTVSGTKTWGGTVNGNLYGASSTPITSFIFNGSSKNLGVVGNATFNASSTNAGTTTNATTFNASSTNKGVVGGAATFNGSAYNTGVVSGNASFNDSSYNTGTVDGNAIYSYASNGTLTLSGSMVYGGTVTGTEKGADNNTVVRYVFNNSSVNKKAITGPATFNDNSSNTAAITGDVVFNGSAKNGGGSDIGNGVVAYWSFDGNVSDSSGNGRDGTIMNGGVTSTSGKVGDAMNFDGSSYINTPSTSYNFQSGITVSLWANPATSGTWWSRFIDFGNGPEGNNILLAHQESSNNLVYSVHGNGYDMGTVIASNALINNEWHYYTATHDISGHVILYRDGIQIASGNVTLPNTVTRNNNYIGKSNWGSDALYQGKMDELGIWDRALSPTEVAELYNGGEGMNALTIPGIITGSATFNGGSSNEGVVNGPATFNNNRPFSLGTVNGTATLTGTNQTINGGTVTNLVKATSTKDTVYLQSGSTLTVAQNITLRGADANNLVSIRSTTPNVVAKVSIQNLASFNFIRLKDIRNIDSSIDFSGKTIYDDGGNQGFIFSSNSTPGTHSFVTTPPPSPAARAAEAAAKAAAIAKAAAEAAARAAALAASNAARAQHAIVTAVQQAPGLKNIFTVLPDVVKLDKVKLTTLPTFGDTTTKTTFSLGEGITNFLFSPLPSKVTEVLKATPELASYLKTAGVSREQDLLTIQRTPVLLPQTTQTIPGLFTVTTKGLPVKVGDAFSTETTIPVSSYVSGSPQTPLYQTITVTPKTQFTIHLKGATTGTFMGKDVTFTDGALTLTTPSQPGRYTLTTSASPLPLVIEIPGKTVNTVSSDAPQQESTVARWFNKLLNFFF